MAIRITGRKSKNGAYYGGNSNKLRSLYKGRTVQVMERGFFETLAKLKAMQEAGNDITPVFVDIIREFSKEQRARFDARVTPDMPPQRWEKLKSKKYARWKVMHGGKRIANLVLNGRLRDAVFGGPGWYAEIGPKSAEWGIRGIPYAAAHQYGYPKNNLPARRFFLAKNDQLPLGVKVKMIESIESYLRGTL